MYPFPLLSKFELGDVTALYFKEGDVVSFCLIPAGTEEFIPKHRDLLNDSIACRAISAYSHWDIHGNVIEPLISCRIAGEHDIGDGKQGASMRINSCITRFKFVEQKKSRNEIRTILEDDRKLRLTHVLEWKPGNLYCTMHTEFTNGGRKMVELELLESFNLGCVSPFQPADGIDQYRIYRYLSNWCAEGRPLVQMAEELNFEPTWHRCTARNLRFGHRSSWPVEEYLPSIAIEDVGHGVVWAAQLCTTGPWQIDVYRHFDFFNIAGGMPDAEFGNWSRKVEAGETVVSFPVAVTCIQGGVDEAFGRIATRCVKEQPFGNADAEELPIMFNEFCTTWGHPYPKALKPEIKCSKKLGVKYFILDDGWFEKLGDWAEIKEREYPGGFGKFINEIRQAGFVPGIWFEMEHCLYNSHLREHTELLLKKNGKPFESSGRYILDMRKPAARKYLDNTMVKIIRDYGIGYIKVDYNTSFVGADTQNGTPGIAVAEYLEAVKKYFLHLKKLFPELVIEVCASGGHRMTNEWLRIGDVHSISDVHETLAIPIVAANAIRHVPMSKAQIWSTIRPDNDAARLSYLICAGFLGRLCFSGTPSQLPKDMFEIVRQGAEFYDKVRPFIKEGITSIDQCLSSGSYEYPRGYQVVSRMNGNGTMFVFHGFADVPKSLSIPVDGGHIAAVYAPSGIKAKIVAGELRLSNIKEFTACTVIID